MPDDPARQAYLTRLRSAEGVKDFGMNYFKSRGSDPYLNPFARSALKRAQGELPILSDLYNVNDNDLEAKFGQYFSGEWNPSGNQILAERDRLGGMEGSIFATGDSAADQAQWQQATLLGRADLGANWANAYGSIEQKRADEFNSMLAQKAASGSPWEGYFSGWRMGLPQMSGTMAGPTPGGGAGLPAPTAPGTPAPTTPAPATPAPTPTTPTPVTPTPGTPGTPGTPAPGTTPPPGAAPVPGTFRVTSQPGGVAFIEGGTAQELRNYFVKNRSPTGHPDAPGISSFRLGNYLYQAPRDTARKFRDSNGNGRYMGSGYNKMIERADLLLQQGVAKTWDQALTGAIDWIMSRGSGFGFSRVA